MNLSRMSVAQPSSHWPCGMMSHPDTLAFSKGGYLWKPARGIITKRVTKTLFEKNIASIKFSIVAFLWCLYSQSTASAKKVSKLCSLKNHSASGRNGLECNGFSLEVPTCRLSLFVSVLLLWPVDNFPFFVCSLLAPFPPTKQKTSHHPCFRQMFSRDFFQQINQKKKGCQVDTLHHNDFLHVSKFHGIFMVSHQHLSLPGSQSLLDKTSTDRW